MERMRSRITAGDIKNLVEDPRLVERLGFAEVVSMPDSRNNPKEIYLETDTGESYLLNTNGSGVAAINLGLDRSSFYLANASFEMGAKHILGNRISSLGSGDLYRDKV